MDAQLKKGVLKLCVLRLLDGGRCYGYTLMQEIQALFPEVDPSTVYALLRRLYDDGDAQVETVAGTGGPARKYYCLTPQGAQSLADLEREWRELAARVPVKPA